LLHGGGFGVLPEDAGLLQDCECERAPLLPRARREPRGDFNRRHRHARDARRSVSRTMLWGPRFTKTGRFVTQSAPRRDQARRPAARYWGGGPANHSLGLGGEGGFPGPRPDDP